ncbi:shikimate dehydrogenase family protein [Paraburkholderia diazotrophica]|uniref:Shikimate dehydrogenase n=1 Tax=Paraburkholderia diazotrophica TaxID=667676 RepID=A0A1H7ERY1_9BURK|nr:ThiF family adenylyltransferase [Paraburkholderia diazotrophica]SEK13505.1 shikimate dehydrogenase [Paraburkholderia diazotrophica]
MISGKTTLIAHIGYPTESFKSPMIYNPWFEQKGIDAVVVPMGVKIEDYEQSFASIFRFTNLHGALITMPHKVTTVRLVDEVTPAVHIAGACNAVLKRPDGTLLGDQFDGAGFVRGVLRKGRRLAGARVLVSGAGGVGSAIAASLAAAGVGELALYDTRSESAEGLARRLREHYPALKVSTGSHDPDGFEVVVNATPLGMRADDPLPFDVTRIAPGCFVGEVVMKSEYTPFLRAAREKGCEVQVGTDMLFEMIPAYLEFFGFGSATAEELRRTATIAY